MANKRKSSSNTRDNGTNTIIAWYGVGIVALLAVGYIAVRTGFNPIEMISSYDATTDNSDEFRFHSDMGM